LGYKHDGNGWVEVVVCSRAQPQMKALLAQCGKIFLPPLNNMEIPTLTLNRGTKDVAIKMPNPSMKGKSTLMFQVEGV